MSSTLLCHHILLNFILITSLIQFSSASNSCSSCSSLSYHTTTAPRDRQLRNHRSYSLAANCNNSGAWCRRSPIELFWTAASVTESPIVRISEHVATPPTAVVQLAVSNALGSAHAAISGETFLAPNSSHVQPSYFARNSVPSWPVKFCVQRRLIDLTHSVRLSHHLIKLNGEAKGN
jgi:hypothetical protein